MPRPFSAATAEQVVAVVEAVYVNQRPADVGIVSNFADLPPDRAEAALKLSVDLGFLAVTGTIYAVASPLCRFIGTPNLTQKAAVLRVVLESYEPFGVFRERLIATNDPSTAAHQVRTALDLSAHREEIKDTLISLGTYSQALLTEGGGRYSPGRQAFENPLGLIARACEDIAAAEAVIRSKIANAIALCPPAEVIEPLADALFRATNNDPRGAVVTAGNAVESYLVERANRMGVNISGATGINAKVDRFDHSTAGTNRLPKKLVFVGKYLGHIRNAADHGIDSDVGAAWEITPSTGIEYVHVACSFVVATAANEKREPPII